MMKKVIGLTIFLILSSLFLGTAQAQETPRVVFVNSREEINHDYLNAGESVTISGVVNGDVYLAGVNVIVDGQVNGDLLVAAGNLSLLGEVSGDVRAVGSHVLVNGLVGKNMSFAGGTLVTTEQSVITGSLMAAGSNLEINGPIGLDAQVYAKELTLNNQIGRDLKGGFEVLTLTSGASINGNLDYKSPQEAEIVGGVVGGLTNYEKVATGSVKKSQEKNRPLKKPNLFTGLPSLIFTFFLGWFFIRLFPQRAKGVVDVLGSRLFLSFGLGLVFLIMLAPFFVFLALTIIGIPFIPLLIPVIGLLIYLVRVFPALWLGQKILSRKDFSKNQTLPLLVGLLLYFALRHVWVLGSLTLFVFVCLGLGAFILDQKNLRKAKKKAKK
ncbi:hypothetical protein ACFL0Y_00135 [Patescibacteria group bacterium]